MKHFLIFLLCLMFSMPVLAEPEQRPLALVKAERYLQSMGTLKARFLQTSQDGSQLIGTFYLSRPGKLRFEYDDPIEDFIVADGFFIYFYDAQLGEQTNAPIGQTLADFLLRPAIRFDGEIGVEKIVREGGLLKITLIRSADPGAGSLTLGFQENPMELRKWRVIDPQGSITEVELFQLEKDIKLASSLFVYSNPNRFETNRYND